MKPSEPSEEMEREEREERERERERESFSDQHRDIDVASVEQLRKIWENVTVQTARFSANYIVVRDRDREIADIVNGPKASRGLCLSCGVGGLSCMCGVSAKDVCHEKCNVVMSVHPSDTSAIATATTTTTNNDNKRHIDETFVVESPMFPRVPARNEVLSL